MKNTRLKQMLAAFGMLAVAVGVTLLAVNYDPEKKKDVEVDFTLESDIVSTDPKVSATNFIKYNGTMGDISQINEEYFSTVTDETNSTRRENAYNKVKDAILPDSPLLSEDILEVIANDNLEFMVFYEIGEIKAGDPSDVYPLVVSHDVTGDVQYEAVDVLLDLQSFQHTFYWPTDVDSESIITHMRSTDNFSDVKVTLVKSGELWFIYNVEDSEYLLNSRMSTWHGKAKSDVSVDTVKVNEYEMNYEVNAE